MRHLSQEAEHRSRGSDHAQPYHAAAPDKLLARGLPVMKSKPIPDKSGRDVEDDGALPAMVRFVLTEHRPDILDAEPFELAMPLPGMLAIRPAIFEGDSM
jgi:hypothetical protein